jgi:hypothetical protein
VISPLWRPVPYDEGGALHPLLLYAAWGILAAGYLALLFALRTQRRPEP